MTFTTTVLQGNRVLVQGKDINGVQNKTVVDGNQWFEVCGNDDFSQAQEAFDLAVEAFFAPLTEAADELHRSMHRPSDSLGYVVLQEEVEPTAGQGEVLVHLTHDSQVLRLIADETYDRLIWVGDNLEIIQVDVEDVEVSVD